MPPGGKQALLDAVHGGKGFVGVHCASDTFNSAPGTSDPYFAMLGGEFIIHGKQQNATLKATLARMQRRGGVVTSRPRSRLAQAYTRNVVACGPPASQLMPSVTPRSAAQRRPPSCTRPCTATQPSGSHALASSMYGHPSHLANCPRSAKASAAAVAAAQGRPSRRASAAVESAARSTWKRLA